MEMKKVIYGCVILLSAAMTSCGVNSDPETEQMLNGEWYMTGTDKFGSEIPVNTLETIEFDAKTHEVVSRYEMYDPEWDVTVPIISFEVTGQWCASKEEIEYDYNVDDIKINTDDSYFVETRSDLKELREQIREITEEIKKEAFKDGSYALDKIIRLTDTELIVRDDDGEKQEWTRVGHNNTEVNAVEEVAAIEEADDTYFNPDDPNVSVYNGKIGKYPVEMQLTVDDNGLAEGRYRYTSSGNGGWLSLRGNCDIGNHWMTLTEFNDKGEQTGTFEGNFGNTHGIVFEYDGVFTNYKGETFSFSVEGGY